MARGADPFLSPAAGRLLLAASYQPGPLAPGWEELAGGHPVPERGERRRGERLFRLARRPLRAGAGPPPPRPGLGRRLGGDRAFPAPGLTLARPRRHPARAPRRRGGDRQGERRTQATCPDSRGRRPFGPSPARSSPSSSRTCRADDRRSSPPALRRRPLDLRGALAALSGLAVRKAVRAHLFCRGAGGPPETVKPGDPALRESSRCSSPGCGPQVRRSPRRSAGWASRSGGDLRGGGGRGGAALVARGRASRRRAHRARARRRGPPSPLGEKTGVGGRNQELALAAARRSPEGGRGGGARPRDRWRGRPTAAAGAGGRRAELGGDAAGRGRSRACPKAPRLAHRPRQYPPHPAAHRPTGTNAADLAVYLRVSGVGATPPGEAAGRMG